METVLRNHVPQLPGPDLYAGAFIPVQRVTEQSPRRGRDLQCLPSFWNVQANNFPCTSKAPTNKRPRIIPELISGDRTGKCCTSLQLLRSSWHSLISKSAAWTKSALWPSASTHFPCQDPHGVSVSRQQRCGIWIRPKSAAISSFDDMLMV